MSLISCHRASLFGGLFLHAVIASVTLAADATPAAAPIKGQRIFTTGHSFHYYMPPILTDVAAKAQVADHKQVGTQPIGGSRVIQHWNLPDDKNKAKQALLTGEIDLLTMSPIYLPDEGIENYAKFGLDKNPNLRITVQEFWLPFDDQAAWDPKNRPKQLDRDTKTIAELRAAHAPYFQSLDDHVRSLNEKFGKPVLFVVPVGQAVLTLREKIIAGEVPGIAKQSELFTDVLGHVHPPVMVLATYCHYAVIYKKSPVGIPVPNIISQRRDAEKLNQLLQEIAWHAVTSHPLSGVQR